MYHFTGISQSLCTTSLASVNNKLKYPFPTSPMLSPVTGSRFVTGSEVSVNKRQPGMQATSCTSLYKTYFQQYRRKLLPFWSPSAPACTAQPRRRCFYTLIYSLTLEPMQSLLLRVTLTFFVYHYTYTQHRKNQTTPSLSLAFVLLSNQNCTHARKNSREYPRVLQ